ncbi:translation elongation factor Ts [Mycoplasma sp. Mirounga ES2805-ORL]|uniref:translation elongation factor Ts n=1 Tax=Mycoplasma sp. Mirounga ES2805-ORL TaxID=754514 RepID=UPI00197BA869|nr:translation elongation factor Ts [Mycoplasma sp. Mirounga ES2805-ORL]QSF13878.1 elongation factor Ts [Mycoplasma sp. Mirounga ES2805-ORL]
MSVNKMELIKELRDRTNAGMIDVKKALEANEWNVEKSITWLKSNGKIKAAKKAGRVSAEGLVTIASNDKNAVLVEVNCETDFVARNEKFKLLVDEIAKIILDSNAKNVDDALQVKVNNETLNDLISNSTAQIGEKISLRRFERVTANKGEVLGKFVHVNGQIAAIVTVEGSHEESARNVAMHAAAMKPEFTFVKEVPTSKVEQFKSEFSKPDNFDKKPEKVQQMILQGSLDKKLGEIVLEKQAFMMEESLTIKKYLANANNKLVSAIRYTVGEGLEKKQSDFASEVAEQMKK